MNDPHRRGLLSKKTNLPRRLIAFAASVFIAISSGPPTALAMVDELQLDGMYALTARQLGGQRGGFSIAGLNINFGFSIETTVENQFTVVSNFNVSAPGSVAGLGTTITEFVDKAVAGAVPKDTPPPSAGKIVAETKDAASSDKRALGAGGLLGSIAGEVDAAVSAAFGASSKSTAPKAAVPPPANEIASQIGGTDPRVPVAMPPIAIEQTTLPGIGDVAKSPNQPSALDVAAAQPAPAESPVTVDAAVTKPSPSTLDTPAVQAPVAVASPVPVAPPITVDTAVTTPSTSALDTPTAQASVALVPPAPVHSPIAVDTAVTTPPVAADTSAVQEAASVTVTPLVSVAVAPAIPDQTTLDTSAKGPAPATVVPSPRPNEVPVSIASANGQTGTVSKTLSGGNNATISIPAETGQRVTVGNAAATQVIHQALNGQLSVIQNRLNDVAIKQSVIMNFTIQNFTQFHAAARRIKSISSLSRHITDFSLRR